MSPSPPQNTTCCKLPELPARTNTRKSNLSEVEWRNGTASGKANAPELTLPQLTLPEASNFAARHRQTLRDMLEYESAADKIQKTWSGIQAQPAAKRLACSRARQLHMYRACSQEGEAVQKQLENESVPLPTVSEATKAKEVLSEAAEDILSARRSVRISSALVEDLQTAALNSKADPKRWKLVKSHGRNLMALATVESILEDSHSAEVQWMELMKSVQAPL
mmetsp:Transcript_75862/g.133998  ORF Transcript_75862/g.133998 Transcript_75862/m.133998 type:complete len:222 (-) Transcript_75862:99-764(-)